MSYRPIEGYDNRTEVVPDKTSEKKGAKILPYITILLFFVILSLIVFLYSPYSKIQEINVQGIEMTEEELVLQATRIEIGDSFLKVNTSTIKETIEKLKTVQAVDVLFHFPNRLEILVEEKKIVLYILHSDGTLSPLLNDGTVLVMPQPFSPTKPRPIISNALSDTLKFRLASQLQEVPNDVILALSEIKVTEETNTVSIYTIDGYELQMPFDQVRDKLVLYQDIIEDLKNQNQDKGVIYMFDAIWYTSYSDVLKNVQDKEQ